MVNNDTSLKMVFDMRKSRGMSVGVTCYSQSANAGHRWWRLMAFTRVTLLLK
jgi:hypothetical protein